MSHDRGELRKRRITLKLDGRYIISASFSFG